MKIDISALRASEGVSMLPTSQALEKWRPLAADGGGDSRDNSISILDVIGEGWDGEGVTTKRIAAALRAIGPRDVVVNINSPGGDLFEGLAIFNQLRAHGGRVTVNVLGIAASAASVIAMAGDDIRMGDGAFLMIHNSWGLVIGNRHAMRETADVFDKLDGAMRDIYAERSGQKTDAVAALMDAETFLSASEATKSGFADGDMQAGAAALFRAETDGRAAALLTRRRIEAALGREGYSRKERAEMIGRLAAARDAGGVVERDADEGERAAIRRLISTMKKD